MNKSVLVVLIAFIASYATAQDSVLCPRCSGESKGADICINNVLKGPYPVDLLLQEGAVKLRVVKKIDEYRYRSFENELYLAEGTAKHVDVDFGGALMTGEGLRLERGRLKAEKAIAEQLAAEELKKREHAAEDQIKADLESANSGDVNAMERMAMRYRTGAGVTYDLQEANYWTIKAELSRVNFFPRSREVNVKFQRALKNEMFPSSVAPTSVIAFHSIYFPLSSTSDLVASDPTKATTEFKRLKSQLAIRPSAFGNPDSLLANVQMPDID